MMSLSAAWKLVNTKYLKKNNWICASPTKVDNCPQWQLNSSIWRPKIVGGAVRSYSYFVDLYFCTCM